MPGLIRGAARVAVVAGTATAVSNRVSRRQERRWAEQDAQAYQQQAPYGYEQAPGYPAYGQAPAEPAAQTDRLEQLAKLGELKAAGVLTEAEFEAQKAKILAG